MQGGLAKCKQVSEYIFWEETTKKKFSLNKQLNFY